MKNLSVRDLAQCVARELGAPEAQAQLILDQAAEVLKRELQRGNQVELPQFLSLSVKVQEPPPANSEGQSELRVPAPRALVVEVDPVFGQQLAGPDKRLIMLVAPKSNFFTGMAATRLTSSRSQAAVVIGEDAACAQMKQQPPDLIVLDAGLAAPEKVIREAKLNRATNAAAIIRILPEGADPKAVKGLEVQGDEALVEPFDVPDLAAAAETELERAAEEGGYFDHAVHFKLPSRKECVDEAHELFRRLVAQANAGEEAAESLAVAFREALDNCARHGNQSEESRLVDVQYLVDREKVTVALGDEGAGFDAAPYLSRGAASSAVDAARERRHEGGAGGLGIMLMLRCVDRLEYHQPGNRVTLTKYIRKPKA